jgi:hypothetical protein
MWIVFSLQRWESMRNAKTDKPLCCRNEDAHMVGFLPVFDDEAEANKWAEGKYVVMKCEAVAKEVVEDGRAEVSG